MRAAGLGVALGLAIAAVISGWVPSGSGPEPDETGPEVLGEPRVPKSPVAPGPGHVVGYVRDVNGNPVSGARVRVAGTRYGTPTNPRGRYNLRIPPGRRTLFAEHPAHAPQPVRLTPRDSQRARRGTRLDFSLARTRGGRAAGPNSADVLIFWTNCAKLTDLNSAELERLVEVGVDGFVCSVGRLRSMGGEHQFSGDPDARLRGTPYRLQRKLRASAAARLARAGRLRLYLGFYASDATNPRTPFKDWFDDHAWSRQVLAPVRRLAAAARVLGCAGLALDQELYPVSKDESAASWSWDYPGAGRSERAVRAQVERRGRQLMAAMLSGYPSLELLAYDTKVPGSWAEKVQEVVNHHQRAFARDVRIDLWDGLSSVQGYAAIRWLDATFYKTPHLGGEDWSIGLEYNANRIYALLSRRFSNWPYASSRLHVTPFSWINEGPSKFAAAREPRYVADQLAAFHRWGTGGLFGNFAYGGPAGFDYGPYADAMRSASTSGTVDRSPPTLSIISPSAGGPIDAPGARLTVQGTAHDQFGIRAVRWYDDLGRFGTAQLVWDAEDRLSGERNWVTRWRIERVPLSRGMNRITIVAEDIKGLARVGRLTVRR
jgi:hypothetical protein